MEELSFPRGGSSKRPDNDDAVAIDDSESNKRNKKRKASSQKTSGDDVTSDFLFGTKPEKEDRKKKSKPTNLPRSSRSSSSTTTTTNPTAAAATHSLMPLGGGGVVVPHQSNKKKLLPYLEALSFQKLSPGTQLLAKVKEIQDEFAILSLPNLLTGYVLLENHKHIQSWKRALTPGQVLNVAVLKVVTETVRGGATKRRIQLSVAPSQVNKHLLSAVAAAATDKNVATTSTSTRWRGQILSVEDHGCLIDLGLSQQGFLKFEHIRAGPYKIVEGEGEGVDDSPEEDSKTIRLQAGKILDVQVLPRSTKEATTAAAVWPLQIPKTSTWAQTMTTPPLNKSTSSSWTLSTLQPGLLVMAKVEAVAQNGVCVTFLNNVFRGSLEFGPHCYLDPLKTVMEQYQHFPARILAVDIPSKLIRLSLASHILTLETSHKNKNQDPDIGAVVENATVVRLDNGIGALLALPQNSDDEEEDAKTQKLPKKVRQASDLFDTSEYQASIKTRLAYVHISKAYDRPDGPEGSSKKKKKKSHGSTEPTVSPGQFAKDFAVGTKHTVRILKTGEDALDRVSTGGCAPSLLEAHVLTHADIHPGQLHSQVPVYAHLPGGSILVHLGGTSDNPVRGLIPFPHHVVDQRSGPQKSSSEFYKRVLETKFAVDAKVDVRVLWTDPIRKKCTVTAKKSLVKVKKAEGDEEDDSESNMIVTSYEDLKVGQKAVGFISKMDDRALFVTFFNRVYGKVTAKSLASELGMENPQQHYQVGDTVTCRVVQITKKKGRSFGQDDMDEDSDHEMEEEVDEDHKKPRAFYKILLSFNLQGHPATPIVDDDDTETDAAAKVDHSKPQQIHIQTGAILPEKSMKIVELFKGKRRGNHNIPGYAIVSIKSKYLVTDKTERENIMPEMECKLPFDQLLDEYDAHDIASPESLDALAALVLRVGKKINQKAIVLSDPHKTNVDHLSGIGKLAVVSIRKSLIATVEAEEEEHVEGESEAVILPSPSSSLYVGALLKGYVAQVDPRHGAFLRFLDGMTGLIPRVNGGLDLPLYKTMIAKVQVIDDTVKPYRVLLQPVGGTVKKAKKDLPFKVGDKISEAKVKGIRFLEARLETPESQELKNVKIWIHTTMKKSEDVYLRRRKPAPHENYFVKGHPFYKMRVNDVLKNLTVVHVKNRRGTVHVQVTDKKMSTDTDVAPTFVERQSELKAGMTVSAIVTEVTSDNRGVHVMVTPSIKGFVPGIELSQELNVLNDMKSHVPLGAKLTCVVIDEEQWKHNRSKSPFGKKNDKKVEEAKKERKNIFFSVVAVREPASAQGKPEKGKIVIGRINKKLPQYHGPSLMLDLRGGFLARCCITEAAEVDNWENMPLGKPSMPKAKGDNHDDGNNDNSSSDHEDEKSEAPENDEVFQDGKYLKCRVLKSFPKVAVVDVSLRSSRLEGDLDDDDAPPEGETVQGYVVETNKKGCFVRLARHIDGRATLTELCDGYLPDPTASFPPGRLVVGKVKSTTEVQTKTGKSFAKFNVDLDMRESTLLDTKKILTFDDIELQGKYKGTVTRIQPYGVFVQVENSKVTGLVHLSECSDNFVKNLASLYDPGDRVKILVIKKDPEEKKIGFSMKPSHFDNDPESDDSSVESLIEDEEQDEDAMDIEEVKERTEIDDLDSDDENFARKLKDKLMVDGEEAENDNGSDDEGGELSESDSSTSDSDDDDNEKVPTMDTDVGFTWDLEALEPKKKAGEEDDSESSDSESENEAGDEKGTSHKSRKKQAERRREEKEISKREMALADGTADENPETAGDFERLLAGSPNDSELWIRYMAFHLSLADIPAARLVAEKALDRIEFREEQEKLNVWTALLTLEHKYGTDASLKKAIERACGQNNPKHVYLRLCEILEKDLSNPENLSKADAMYSKMCSKFKSKKKAWLAHIAFLVKQSRNEEAQALLKRALLSLPTYKHAECMSRFAQLEYEFGSPERARTLFDGLVAKFPKRLDLFFVYVDKEVKFGNAKHARKLLEGKVENGKLSDKQVKSIFKKWYRFEEQHGTPESMEHVKEAARQYVEKSSS